MGIELRNSRDGKKPKLTYTVEKCTLPAGARLRECWRICIHSCVGLPHGDLAVTARDLSALPKAAALGLDKVAKGAEASADPYVLLTATSPDKRFTFHQQTSVVK